MEKNSFLMYTDWLSMIEELDNEQRGVLFLAIMRYQSDGDIPEMKKGSGEKIAFAHICTQFLKDQEKYNKTVASRSAAGKLGGRPKANISDEKQKKQMLFEESNKNQSEAKKADNDNDNDNVNEKDNKKHLCTAEAAALFERLWKLYPVKKGKGQVSDTQKKKLLAIGEPALLKAIERYRAELAKDSGWRRPQNGSTFFNSGYVDYLDANFSPDKPVPRKSSSGAQNKFCNFEQRNYNYDELIYADIKGGTG